MVIRGLVSATRSRTSVLLAVMESAVATTLTPVTSVPAVAPGDAQMAARLMLALTGPKAHRQRRLHRQIREEAKAVPLRWRDVTGERVVVKSPREHAGPLAGRGAFAFAAPT